MAKDVDNDCDSLHRAVRCGDREAIRTQLDKGISIDLKSEKFACTALQIAVREKDTDLVKFLLECKSDVNQLFENGWTPLMTAAFHGNASVVKTLLDHKADRCLRFTGYSQDGDTALNFATFNNDCDTIREIVAMLEASPAPEAPPAPFPSLSTGCA